MSGSLYYCRTIEDARAERNTPTDVAIAELAAKVLAAADSQAGDPS